MNLRIKKVDFRYSRDLSNVMSASELFLDYTETTCQRDLYYIWEVKSLSSFVSTILEIKIISFGVF